ncbi:MAG TPA: hypothetical protein VF178_12815 [Gemmatimonadaceae bacterium]
MVDGQRLRAVTAAAARAQVRAGMSVAEARARCAALELLPWDEMAVADEIRRATAAFLAASPQVTPVAGAPGMWWIGATGLEATGGERALVRSLYRIASRWHPAPRIAVADSCVAARAGTWDRGARTGTSGGAPSPIVVPPGGCAAYLASVPLGLIPMDEELRQTLAALGIRTAGAFAAFTAEDVERRWGAAGLTAWRLARGDDRRRPGLTRADAPRCAAADLVPSVTTLEPVLFLVRAALDRLVRDLVADGRAAATVAVTLTLDDARGRLPGARAHTVTREVRLVRPLARTAPLLERCRALLDQWPLTAPVCGVTVAIVASAPLTGEQGDLLDPSWRDPAAADAAFARLRATLGPDAIVIPVARDEHRPERAGAWVEMTDIGAPHPEGAKRPKQKPRDTIDAKLTAFSDPLRASGHPEGAVATEGPAHHGVRGWSGHEVRRAGPSPAARDVDGTPSRPSVLRQLASPEPAEVECSPDGTPRLLWWRGRRIRLAQVLGPERLGGDWWKDGYARDYWRCEEAPGDGESELVVFQDHLAGGGWYVHGWYD